MKDRDVLADLRTWRDNFAQAHGYDIRAMATTLQTVEATAGLPVVRGEPRRPAGAIPGMHKVVLYVNERLRQFSVTARMDRARLHGVNDQMANEGYTPTLIAEGLTKHEAERLRDGVRAEYESKGYLYQTRPPLS